ncbi:MAG: phage portal protein, partial [Acidobacteria bacterium]
MPIILTDGATKLLAASRSGVAPFTSGEGGWFGGGLGVRGDFAAMYRSQPNVRICVDFLSRNIGQLALQVFARNDSNNSRDRDRTGGLAQLLAAPNPQTTPSRLIAGTVADLSIFGHAFWVKIGHPGQRRALWRVPPTTISVDDASALGPTSYTWTSTQGSWTLRPDDVLHFRFYDPESEWSGCSPLETLRRTLAEERAASDHRLALWRNGARIAGVIERPKESGVWSDAARDKFREQWEAKYAGPARSGRVAILEDGMTWKQAAYSMADTEANETRKLNIEEVARVYQIPLTNVGILEHATFSNIREQHKQLYQDCLAPITVQLEDEVNLGLLTEYHDPSRYYTEFNISEKLKGSFEEQARAIQVLVGGPVMTRNEGRARLNLPAVDGGDELLLPMNTTTASAGLDANQGDPAT